MNKAEIDMRDMDALKQLLISGGYTCVLSDGEDTVTSRESGIKPLMEFIESGKNYCGYKAADKIVGKAAALLYAYMGISALYASVMSAGAQEVCRRFGIECFCDTLTDRIINRKGDDVCPMEKAVEGIDDPRKAKEILRNKLNLYRVKP